MNLQSVKERINRPSVLPLTAAVGAQVAGVPVISALTPPFAHSLYTGVITGASFIHWGGLHFSGAWGYRTFFSGRISGFSRLTLGNAALSAIESIGKRAWEQGYRNQFTAWALNARELGLAGLFGEVKPKDISQEVLARIGRREGGVWISKARSLERFTLSHDPRINRFLGGLSDKVERIFTVSYKKGDEVVTKLFPKFSSEGGFLLKGKKWAIGGTLLTAYSLFELANMVATPLINYALKRAANAAGMIKQFAIEQRQFHMGRGYLGPSFQNYYAATERQRAVQAIYAARVNPSSRIYGNEASYYHR